MRLSHRRVLGGVVLAATAATVAVGFMLPVRPRLREPNDVHRDFKLAQPQPQQPLAGPGLLLQSADPALPALGAASAAAGADGHAEQEAALTAFEELFSIDKSHGLEGFSILDSPINADPLVVMEGAGAAAFVPLQEITHEGRVIRQRGVGGADGGNLVERKAALLKEVAAHLTGQARQAFLAMRDSLLAYVDGLLQALQKLFSAGDDMAEGGGSARRRGASRPRRATVGDRVARRYQTARASAAAGYGELVAGAAGAWETAQAAVAGKAAGLRAELALLVAACRARVGAWRGVLAGKFARWQGALERDERFCAVKGRCAAAAAKAEKAAGRALGTGRRLAVRAKAWGLSLRARLPFDSSDAAGAAGAAGSLARPVRLGGVVGGADETQVPPFSLAYVSGGASGVGAGGARAAYSSLLDSPFDFDDSDLLADAPYRAPMETVAVAVEEPMAEEAGPVAAATASAVLRDALCKAAEEEMVEAVNEEVGTAVASSSSMTTEATLAEDETNDEEDDGPSSGGGSGGPQSEAVAEAAAMPSSSTTSSTSSDAAAMFAGLPVTPAERAAADALRVRLGALPAGQAGWVEEADLLRYAREFDADAEAAWTALARTCAWRAERGVEAFMATADFSESPLGRELFWMGADDKEGDPVLLFRTALHRPGALPTETYVEFMTWLLETGRQRYGLGKGKRLTLLVDRKDAGLRQQDPLLVLNIVPLLQAHYPGCLKLVMVAPSTAVFNLLWRVFTFILAPSTTARVKLLGPGTEAVNAALATQFHPASLPTHLGGTLHSYDERGSTNGTTSKAGNGGNKPALSAA